MDSLCERCGGQYALHSVGIFLCRACLEDLPQPAPSEGAPSEQGSRRKTYFEKLHDAKEAQIERKRKLITGGEA